MLHELGCHARASDHTAHDRVGNREADGSAIVVQKQLARRPIVELMNALLQTRARDRACSPRVECRRERNKRTAQLFFVRRIREFPKHAREPLWRLLHDERSPRHADVLRLGRMFVVPASKSKTMIASPHSSWRVTSAIFA